MTTATLPCIDLKATFGDRYRIVREASGLAHGADPDAAWLQTIPCQFGHIYIHGEKTLGATTQSRGPTAKLLAALSCVTKVQDGDDGINVIFDAKDFAPVAVVMKPKRRRSLSPEHTAKLVAAGRAALASKTQSN